MAERTLTLPEDTYRRLLAVAQAQGITPERWIVSKLSEQSVTAQSQTDSKDRATRLDNAEQKPLSELLSGLPTVDSRDGKFQGRPVDKDDLFGQYVIEKMKKQGIYLPEDSPTD